MDKDSRFVGLDVHAETIGVGVAEPGGEVRSLGTIPNTPEAVRRLVKKLGPPETLRVCYEAGPTGYVLYRQLSALGVPCAVIAPTLVPVKAGDRVKTDRRDAEKLARSYRSGDLTPVWVPDPATKRCAIWCARGRRRRRISSAPGIGWGNSCCARGAARPREARPGA